MVGSDHAHFMGNTHAYVTALRGLLAYAQQANDINLKEMVRCGYEYMRAFGLKSIGLFGEMCTTGDMTRLAIELSEAGVGDYWEDVDRYVRNHLTELQITDAAKMQSVINSLPDHTANLDPAEETRNDVLNRNLGWFLSSSTHATLIPADNQLDPVDPLMWNACCTGSCIPALYDVWNAIVHCNDSHARINLLLNRASSWLDIDSYLPYEGKVVIRNKNAAKVSIRLPRWVDKSTVACQVNDQPVAHIWLANFLRIEGLLAGDRILITFPMTERSERFSIKWPQDAFWTQSTKPGVDPTIYLMTFRGNTLVDIFPRNMEQGYPLYQRDSLRSTITPMKNVTRYIAEIYLDHENSAERDWAIYN